MMDQVVNRMLQHLRKHGYTIQRLQSGLRAAHEEEFDFIISRGAGGVKFQIFFRLSDDAMPHQLIKLTNDLNRQTVVSKFYLDQDSDFVIDAWFPLTYDETGFESFVIAWQHDLNVLSASSDAANALA